MTTLFRIVAFLEGISYLLLLGVGMPLKYMNDDPSWVKALGMPHGILFIAYIVLAFIIRKPQGWNFMRLLWVWALSLFPFGTFWVEWKWIKK